MEALSEATAAHALEKALAEVQTPEQAERVIRELHRRAGTRTVGDIAERVSAEEAQAAAIAKIADAAPAGECAVDTFAAAAEQMAAAPPAEGGALDTGIIRATNPLAAGAENDTATPHLESHRRRLRLALIKELAPLRAMDTAVFLDINQLPHPRWMNRLMRGLTIMMKRADALAVGLFLAALRDPKRGSKALAEVLPSLWLATFIIETPVKRFFRRQRPFVEVVRATVVGRRPGSFSFPSGHSAAAFAGAALLRRHYPRWTAAFYGLALAVGFSRVYLGAHYPGDVLTGGVGGTVMAETCRALLARPTRRLAPLIYKGLRALLWLRR